MIVVVKLMDKLVPTAAVDGARNDLARSAKTVSTTGNVSQMFRHDIFCVIKSVVVQSVCFNPKFLSYHLI